MAFLSVLGVVFLATLASMVVGMIWYHPKVFGNVWKKHTNIVLDKKSQRKAMIQGFLSEYLMIFGFLLIILFSSGANFFNFSLSPLTLAILVWFTIIVPTTLDQVIYEKKNTKIFLIGIFHRLIALVCASLVFMFL